MLENIEIKEDGRLSFAELRFMKKLASRTEAMDSLDRESLVNFLATLKNEKKLYLERKDVKKASKEYINTLFDRVISYISEKVSEDDKLDYRGADIQENVDEKQYTKINIVYGKEKLTKVDGFFEFTSDINKYKIHEIIEPGLTFTYIAGSNNLNKMKKGEESLVTWGEEINGKKTYIFLDGPKKGQRCMLLEGDAIKPSKPEDLKKIDKIRLQRKEQIKQFGHTVGLESFVSEMENKYMNNLDRNDKRYGRKYMANTKRILGKEMSENAKDTLETVRGLSQDEFMEGFDKFSSNLKKIMGKEFPAIQRALIAGSERLMKNAGDDFDDKTHFTIYIPNQDRRLSVGVSFDPVEGFTTFPIGYGMRGFGSREGSKETPLGTFKKIKIKLSGNKYGNLGYTSKSVIGARVDIKGLEKGLNSSTSNRGVLLHGVTRDRERRLETGEGYTPRSWGCIVSPTEVARNIAETQKGQETYYEIMPPIS